MFAHQHGYDGPPPSDDYARELLADDGFLMRIAERQGVSAGAITTYRLRK